MVSLETASSLPLSLSLSLAPFLHERDLIEFIEFARLWNMELVVQVAHIVGYL